MTDPNFADKASWKVVSPPPALSIAAADGLLDAWRGGRSIVEVEPLAGGIMNWNYRIRLSGSAERFVLRLYDRMPESCAKEVRIANCQAVPAVLRAVARNDPGRFAACFIPAPRGITSIARETLLDHPARLSSPTAEARAFRRFVWSILKITFCANLLEGTLT